MDSQRRLLDGQGLQGVPFALNSEEQSYSSLIGVSKKEIDCVRALPEPKSRPGRRAKRDEDPRANVCGCGKSYLSFAALYTHAKTKHDGTFPEETVINGKKKQPKSSRTEDPAAKAPSKAQRKLKTLERDFCHFLSMIPGARDEAGWRGRDLAGEFPSQLFASRELFEPLLETLGSCLREAERSYGEDFRDGICGIVLKANSSKALTCDEAFCFFLIFAARFCSLEFFREVCVFVVGFRAMMNELGWSQTRQASTPQPPTLQPLNASTAQPPNPSTAQRLSPQPSAPPELFCKTQPPEHIPNFANDYIIDFFPMSLRSRAVVCQPCALWFLGASSVKILRLILLTKEFCTWLSRLKLTSSNVKFFYF